VPQHLAAVNGNKKVILSWNAVRVPDGTVVYHIYYRDVTTGGAGAAWIGADCPGATSSPCPYGKTVAEAGFLTNGDHYQFSVKSSDFAGESAQSKIVDGYPTS